MDVGRKSPFAQLDWRLRSQRDRKYCVQLPVHMCQITDVKAKTIGSETTQIKISHSKLSVSFAEMYSTPHFASCLRIASSSRRRASLVSG